MAALRKHWLPNGDRITACGRQSSTVEVVLGNPEAVTCLRCQDTFIFNTQRRRLAPIQR